MVSSQPATWATGHADILKTVSFLFFDHVICDGGEGGCHFNAPTKYIDVWNLQ
jgi:hypothetical protein